jgi:hypothetical protein
MLMLAFFKILILDAKNDEPLLRNLKRSIYDLMYIDNGALTGDYLSSMNIVETLENTFGPYFMELQQFATNYAKLQIEKDTSKNVPAPQIVKLLGMRWDPENDKIAAPKLELLVGAKTKRNSIYDSFQL